MCVHYGGQMIFLKQVMFFTKTFIKERFIKHVLCSELATGSAKMKTGQEKTVQILSSPESA